MYQNAVLCVTAPSKPKIGVFMLQITMFFLRREMYSIKKNATNIREVSGTAGNLPFVSAFMLKADFGWISPFVCIFMRGLILTSSNLPFIVEIFVGLETGMRLLSL